VRNIKRGREGVERGRMPPWQGMTAHQRARPTWLTLQQKNHMNNDVLILGFNFEPIDEGIRYMKHNKNVISFLLAIHWLSRI
jgi:hypothetical protein